MKINLSIGNNSVSTQLFDKWYAYRQSLDTEHYDASVSFIQDNNVNLDYCNIKLDSMPDLVDGTNEKFDFVLLCNGLEPLATTTHAIVEQASNPNTYLICNSYVTKTHALYNKIICYSSHPSNCNDFWTRSFYPQYFNNHQLCGLKKDKNITAINGNNRSDRYYFFSLLQQACPELLIKDTYGTVVTETNDSLFESPEDEEFRYWVNSQYEDIIQRNTPSNYNYYASGVKLGINGAFGRLPPGYFILDLYFSSHCVIFPESTWQNNEVCCTEKILKCFYAGCFPWPVGGSNINALYNELGYYTAWNLLPDELKIFDSIENHCKRYQQQVQSIKWLNDHPEVFVTDKARDMLNANQLNFLKNSIDLLYVQKFDQFLKNITNEC